MIERKGNRYDRPKPEITLLHKDGSLPVLKIEWLGETIKVRIHKRHAKAIIYLNRALEEDAGLDEEYRGLRTNAQIAKSYADDDPLGYTPFPKTIAHYRAQVERLLRDAAPEGFPNRLMRTVRGAGVGLIYSIKVIDLSHRDKQ